MAIKPNVLNGLTKEQETAVLQEAAKIYNSQENKDKRVIQQYESTPDYNILERTFNSVKRDDYKAKQSIASEYNAAKGRQTEKFIADNGITDKQLESLWVTSKTPGLDASKHEIASMPNADVDWLVKYYEDNLNKKALQNVADATSKSPVAMNALSSVGNTLSNAGYGLGTTLEWLTGKPDLADNLDFGVRANQAIRGTTKDMIGESKKVANALYDVGMGVADFGGALALGGGNPLWARTMQTASAVGGSAYDAKGRGLTDSQAMAEGLVGGAAELALSKLPFDTLTRTNADDAFLKTILKQGVSEALEEGGTSAVNAIADSIIAGENSNFNLKKQEYMAQGLSEEEANKGALLDTLKEVGYEGLIGGLSGTAIGGINLGTQKVAGKYANTNNELEPLAETATEPTTERAQMPLEPLETQQTTNTMSTSENGLNDKKQAWKNNIINQIKNIFTGNVPKGNLIELGDTPQILKEYGAPELKLSMTQDAMFKMAYPEGYNGGKHNLGFDIIAELPYLLADPIAILKSDTQENSMVIVNEYVDQNGYPIISAIHLNKNGKIEPINQVASMYGKRDIANWALKQKEKGNLLYEKTNKGISTIAPDGLQLSSLYANADPLSNNSIPNPANSVNNQTTYNTKKIDGFEEVSKQMNKLIGMYGNNEVKAMHNKVNSLVNEYIATNDTSKFHEAAKIASEIDRQLLGKTYKYKATRKGTKGENARAEVTYTPDSYIDTLFSEVSNYQDVARENTANNVVPDLANAEILNQYSDVSNMESDSQRVRSYNETLIDKTDAPTVIKNELIDNPEVYNQLSNKATLEKAMEVINNNDTNTAIVEFRKYLDATNPVAVPLGYNLSKKLVAENRVDEAVQIVRDIEKALTRSGQFSQAAVITMLNNSPEAAFRYMVREIDNLNKKGVDKFGKKWKDFELTESEIKRFGEIESGDTDAIKQAYQDVYNRLKKDYPATFKEKLMELRRIDMLLNVRTNIRNVVSNALLFSVRWTSDRVAALGEGVYSLINPNYERTQSLNPVRSKKSRTLAKEIFEANKDVLLGTNKYDDASGAMRDKQVFKGTMLSRAVDTMLGGAITKANNAMGKDVNPSLMETARNFTYFLLQKGDDVFVKQNFISRLSSYLDAQGITDIADVPADAITLATQEAMKATFKDDSAFANGLTQFRQMLNKVPGGMLGDIVMPFTKTPANLAMRGIDYSPVGVINGVKTLRNAKTNADVAKGITQLGQAATGTAAIALGYVLAESGLIKGALSDDKDEAQFQKQQGELAYSIKTPWGDYVTYDWAQPASIPLILGATIYDSLKNDDVSIGSAIAQGGVNVVDSWLELSPLQNLSEIFGGYGTPAENVLDVLTTDFPLSFIPSQLGAVARSTDTTQRTAYSKDYLDNLKNQAMAKVPGLSQKLPATYDTWGNEVQRYSNVAEGLFANMINPGQTGNAIVTEIDDDILSLYNSTGNNAVYPRKADWSYDVDGENIKLSNEQYAEMQKIMGSNSYDMAESFITSDYYGSLSDANKVKVIADLYTFSVALAKSEVLGYDVKSNDSFKNAYAVYKEKGAEGVAQYYTMRKLAGSNAKLEDYVNAVDKMGISNEEKGFILAAANKPSAKETKEQEKVSQIKNEYGNEGLYNYYTYKSQIDSKKKIDSYDVISQQNLSDEEKGFYLRMLDTSSADSTIKDLSSIETAYGLDGLYDWYTIKENTRKDTNAGKIMSIETLDISKKEKGYYLSLYLGSISKEAEKILENDGYEAFYDYYFNKTQKDREELEAYFKAYDYYFSN